MTVAAGTADSWRRDPNAPAPGTPLGPLDAIPDGGMREFRFGEGRRVFSLLVVRCGVEARAYVNACPHVWLPLTYRHDRVLSGDGRRLVCSNHAAEFSVEDGSPLSGPLSGPPSGPVAADCRLTAVPVRVDDQGHLSIGHSSIGTPA